MNQNIYQPQKHSIGILSIDSRVNLQLCLLLIGLILIKPSFSELNRISQTFVNAGPSLIEDTDHNPDRDFYDFYEDLGR